MYHFALVNFHHPLVVNLETMLFLEGLALKHFSSVGLLTFPSNIIWFVWGKVDKVVISLTSEAVLVGEMQNIDLKSTRFLHVFGNGRDFPTISGNR